MIDSGSLPSFCLFILSFYLLFHQLTCPSSWHPSLRSCHNSASLIESFQYIPRGSIGRVTCFWLPHHTPALRTFFIRQPSCQCGKACVCVCVCLALSYSSLCPVVWRVMPQWQICTKKLFLNVHFVCFVCNVALDQSTSLLLLPFY